MKGHTMSRIPAIVGAFVVLGAACTASLATSPRLPAQAGGATPTADLTCEFQLTQKAGQVQVQAKASALAARSGTYTLALTHAAPSGRSEINQSGDFALQPGQTLTLGEASFTGKPANIRAQLDLRAGSVTQRCVLPAP
jgi:hypothetical protein